MVDCAGNEIRRQLKEDICHLEAKILHFLLEQPSRLLETLKFFRRLEMRAPFKKSDVHALEFQH